NEEDVSDPVRLLRPMADAKAAIALDALGPLPFPAAGSGFLDLRQKPLGVVCTATATAMIGGPANEKPEYQVTGAAAVAVTTTEAVVAPEVGDLAQDDEPSVTRSRDDRIVHA